MLELSFFERAVAAGVLASIAGGIVGSFVVIKRISSISGGLSHAAFGGVGVALALGAAPLAGATIFCLLAAGIITLVYRTRPEAVEPVIGVIWSAGMALGMLLIAMLPGYAPSISEYLFGSILFTPEEYLWWVLGLNIGLIILVSGLFRELRAVSFDEEFAEVLGVNVGLYFFILLALVSVTIVALIAVVGVILTIALLTTPALIARQWSDNLRSMILLAVGSGVASTLLGLYSSEILSGYAVNAPPGPLIILAVTLIYIVSSAIVWRKHAV